MVEALQEASTARSALLPRIREAQVIPVRWWVPIQVGLILRRIEVYDFRRESVKLSYSMKYTERIIVSYAQSI